MSLIDRPLVTIFVASAVFAASFGTPAPVNGSAPGRPPRVSYTTFEGRKQNLYAWPGRHLVFFTKRADLDKATMARVLDTYDRVYECYLEATGSEPINANVWQGKTIVAQVDHTCGAGCGLIGNKGVELAFDIFDNLYRSARRGEGFDHVVLYELGRNFWRYGPQIEANELIRKGPDDRGSGDAFVNGFPILMECAIAEHLRLRVPGMPSLRAAHKFWVERFLSDPRMTIGNTVLDFKASLINAPDGRRIGAMDFFAAIMMQVASEQGGWHFLSRF